MNVFRTSLFTILMLFLVSAQCDYIENFEITDISVTTIYPQNGDETTLVLTLESEGFSTNEIQIFYDEGYTKRFITSEQIYISKGTNVYEYEFKLPQTAHSIGIIEVLIGSKGTTIPVIYEESSEPQITEMENEENYTLIVKSDSEIKFKINNDRVSNVQSVEGIVSLNIQKCNNCEMFITFNYDEEEIKIYKEFGEYVKPFVYVSNIENKKIEFESCPHKEIEIVNYETGYEKYNVEGLEVDLSKFNSEEKNEIKVIKNGPLTLLITAKDELNREIKSQGELFVECDVNNYFSEIEFVKEKEMVFTLDKNATCNFTYGDAKVNANVLAQVNEEVKEEKVEVIYWDDYITYALVLLVVLVMGIILFKWKNMSKR